MFRIKIGLYGEKVHILEGPRPPHSWVWWCDLVVQSSSVPLEAGDTFVLDIEANSAWQRSPSLLLVAFFVLVFAFVELHQRVALS